MKISFCGAAREVTGSCHLLRNESGRILLDCGMIQGGRERHQRNRDPFPFSPEEIDAVVLSHAHIDHSGRLPLLVRRGYRGPIFATEPTVDLCRILLADSARIHEEDARWKIKRLKKRGEDHSWVKPLFTEEDAQEAVERFVPVPFDSRTELDGHGSVYFHRAGHILGASSVEVGMEEGGVSRSILFSGDLGVEGARLLGRPASVPCPDYLLVESTYGNRSREEPGDRTEILHDIILRTVKRGGKVIIPAFAVGRTQEILARINDLVESGKLKDLPVFLDSPMAIEATGVFARHPGAWSDEARRLLHCGDEPLEFPGLEFCRSVEESREINEYRGPCVIISASGMCTAGRIKHHLRNHIDDSRNTILFVGYQANGTLGRHILNGTDPVRIFGEWYPVQARVERIEGFSAHADREELLDWCARLDGTPRRTFVIHGEEEASLALSRTLRERFGGQVAVPGPNETVSLD